MTLSLPTRRSSDLHAGNVSHHVMQERVGGDGQDHQLAMPPHRDLVQIAHGGARLALRGTKRREVMLADQILRGLVHALFIQRIAHRSEEHTSELQSLMRISYAVFCLKKNKN